MSTSTLGAAPSSTDRVVSRRLAVAWQHPGTRRITAVGLLTCSDASYTFSYLRSAAGVEGFQPFLGFPDLARRYESNALFPLFAQRVMRASRPDFSRYRQALRLGADASDWSILGRSQGQREGDGIRVFPEPYVDEAGGTTVTFFASGLRHRMHQDPRVSAALDALASGDPLSLVDEPANQEDARALLVAEGTGLTLAWVPSVLLSYVHTVRLIAEPSLTVVGTNGPDVPPAYRLLVNLRGTTTEGYRPFDGPEWTLAPERAAV
jgi:hypothetical protein